MGEFINDLPPYANLHDATIISTTDGIYLSCSQVSIYEIDYYNISANCISPVIENVDVDSFLTSKNFSNNNFRPHTPYIAQYIEAKKGIFWQCVFSSESTPSIKDFSFETTQYYDDEKILQAVYYKNEKIESVLNNTTTTGNFVKLWKM